MKVTFTLNGIPRQVVVDPDVVLLDLLRDEFRLTGAKQSCDKKGQCGACTVIVDGKAVRSCLTKVAKLDGADVITIEGLGTPANPHLIQEAFVLAGAVQCGFCTPGMIMAAKALLDVHPDPSTAQIKRALRHNLCRCTGYVKIIEAVKLAGEFLRGEKTPDELRPDPHGAKLGVSHPRPSALIKACGVAQFTADILAPGALELAAVHSPHPHALIKSIDTKAAEAMPGVAGVMTAKDIKGSNRHNYMVPDRPVLCEDRVRYIGDPVAVVAAETREQALAAVAAVRVEYEPLPALGSPHEAMAEGAPQIHSEWANLCLTQPQIKGDAARAFAEAGHVVEGHYHTQMVHQAPLEPEVCLAFFDGEGDDAQLVVVGRSINIHKHLAMLQEATGWEDMRYEEAYVGGQFGIKIDVTSEGIAAAAALHFRRAVRYIPSLPESMYLSPKRHPFDVKVKVAADAEGNLTALGMDVVIDNGAYNSMGNVVMSRAMMMLSGSYNFPAVDARARLVYTNNPWGAAARGAGPPQVNYALESAVDRLAREMKIDPLEFRRRNSLRPGQSKSTGQVVDEWPFPELCDAIKPHYDRAVREAREMGEGTKKRGVGVAGGSFGIGGPNDQSMVAVELDPDDGITVYGAVADPGEGNDSMLSQLAADAMDLPLDKVRLVTRDTDHTTANGPAAASRHTYMSGGALLDAIRQLREAMAACGATTYADMQKAGVPTRYMGTRKTVVGTLDPETGQGPSFESQVHALQLAEVEVDTETGEVRVIRMTCAADAGRVIHPDNVIGQLQGGMDMGVGLALREEYVPGKTKDWVTFKYPTMKTAFDMDVIICETPRKRGSNGAVGVGEMTLVPTAPAVLNAIEDAVGVRIYDLPATPDKVKAALAAMR
ncbi:MAG TPA: molybdopterin-dependent oxidoreductase [Thermoleophilia bacterium]|nr:molybdopterin-dependent oxidoreductase [Thermoleophilia bacterium]